MLCLKAATDDAWCRAALRDLDRVLIDHAHCELKAAANALSLAGRHPDDLQLVQRLTEIAQEEIAHFQRVVAVLVARGLPLGTPAVDVYAAELRTAAKRTPRPAGMNPLVDRLLVAALIEARSCERFKQLARAMREGRPEETELIAFYDELFAAEALHYRVFVDLALGAASDAAVVGARLDALADEEALIVQRLTHNEQPGGARPSMAEHLDLTLLDRDVARTAALVARAERAAKAGADSLDPYEERRQVAGRSTFVALAPRSDSFSLDAPQREGLRRWVFAFTLQRLSRDKALALREAIDEDVSIVERPVSRQISWREAWQEALHGTVTGDVEMYIKAAGDAAATVAPPAREEEAVLREAAHRLEVEDRALFATGVPSRTLTVFARTFFTATDEISRHVLQAEQKRREGIRASVADYLALSLGRSAGEGWPAKLTRRWLEDLAPPLVQGLALEVGTLPEALGASSFARALFAFGRALRIAGPSPSLPFALARDPFPVDAERYGFAFASLVASAPFHRRVLGVGSDVAISQARVGNGMALANARLAAVRWLARGADAGERDELGHRLLGSEPPRDLFAAFPVPRADDASRLLALATTLSFVTELVDRHDEDWFNNPRALADLRARVSAPANGNAALSPVVAAWNAAAAAGTGIADTEATRAARALARHFEHALA